MIFLQMWGPSPEADKACGATCFGFMLLAIIVVGVGIVKTMLGK